MGVRFILRFVLLFFLLVAMGSVCNAQMIGFDNSFFEIIGIKSWSVGEWVKYKSVDKADSLERTIRISIVGEEKIDDTQYFWYEMEDTDPVEHEKVITKMLIPFGEYTASEIQSIIVKTGDQPAVKLPSQYTELMPQIHTSDIDSIISPSVDSIEIVGTETVEVPAGKFSCRHIRVKSDEYEYNHLWVSDKVPIVGFVKTDTEFTYMILEAYGRSGAESAITEPVQELKFPFMEKKSPKK